MPTPKNTNNGQTAPHLFSDSCPGDRSETHEITATASVYDVAGSEVAGGGSLDDDELEMPAGLQDVDSPLPDNWEGPGVGDDELEDVTREAEMIPSADPAPAKEPPLDGAAPSKPAINGRISVSVQSVIIWDNALGDPERVPPSMIDERAAEIRAMGQLRACRGRLLADGHVEVVTGMLEVLAVRQIAADGGEPWILLVDVEEMTDEQAFKVAHAEAAEGVPLAPIDRALFVEEAIRTTFTSQRAMAAAFGIHESNLSRLMDVGRCVAIVGKKVIDPWSISRAQSGRFMGIHNDPGVRQQLRAFLKRAEPQTARKFFRTVFDAFDPAAKRTSAGSIAIVDSNNVNLGHLVPGRKGTMIRLGPEAGPVELPALMVAIEAALNQHRSSAT